MLMVRLRSAEEDTEGWAPCMDWFRIAPGEDDGWFVLERKVGGCWELVDEHESIDDAKAGAMEEVKENLEELRALAEKMRAELDRIDAHLAGAELPQPWHDTESA